MAAGALCVLALAALLAVCGAEEQPKLGPHEVLIRVIRINNGTVDAEVRDVPGRGRGLVAFRPMKKNTIAVKLPRTMAFQLAPVTKALEARSLQLWFACGAELTQRTVEEHNMYMVAIR